MTIDVAPPRLAELIDRLTVAYQPTATRSDVAVCVQSAWRAVGYFGATEDEGMLVLAERIAERELRLRLGLEREVARLDPEDHHR